MKRILIFAIVLTLSIPAVLAQGRKDDGWKERVRAEKIAFLTKEMPLTSQEAQSFWPVYNECCDKKDQAVRNVMRTYRELEKAIETNNGVEAKLNAYVKALDDREGPETEACAKYKKILPAEKVAKFYLADEKFRREQIRRLHHRENPGANSK